MFDRVSLENTRFSPQSLNMNNIIVDSLHQRKFEVHTLFRFEAVDPREWVTYAKSCNTLQVLLIAINCH